MSSFGLMLFLLVASHPQKSAPVQMTQLDPMNLLLQVTDEQKRQMAEASRVPTCFTVRTYRFRQQDGQAPVLASTTTCTPANVLQQRRVFHTPNSLYAPLTIK